MKTLGFAVALLLLVGVGPAAGQSDLTQFQINVPGSNTSGFRVHGNSSTVNLTVVGEVTAGSGYKTVTVYSHNGRVVTNTTDTAVPLAGTASVTVGGNAGTLYRSVAGAGSIIAVAIGASTAVTANAAHAEATILSSGTKLATGLIAVIGKGLTNETYAITTQARGIDIFKSTEQVGCQLTIDSGFTPVTAGLACTVITVE